MTGATDAAAPPLVGYRERVEDFHRGAWLPGELVAFRDDPRPPPVADGPEGGPAGQERVLVSAGHALVSFREIEWVDQRAALEVRILAPRPPVWLGGLLRDALRVAFDRFGLARVEGWVTPDGPRIAPVLRSAGFELEAEVPHGTRLGGRSRPRQVWGAVRA